MNEVMADIYAISGDEKYLVTAERFYHKAVLDPLVRREDRLTGLHANTPIPKITGLARVAALTGNAEEQGGARLEHQTPEAIQVRKHIIQPGFHKALNLIGGFM